MKSLLSTSRYRWLCGGLRRELGSQSDAPPASSQGTFLVMQAVAQALVQSGALGGSIINLGSIVGKVRAMSFPGTVPWAVRGESRAASFLAAVPWRGWMSSAATFL